MTFQAREYRHFPEAGISLVVDVKNGRAQIALCSVNLRKGDCFSRPTARKILDLMLDADVETLRALNLKRRVYSFPYRGVKPRKDILGTLAQRLEDHLNLRRKSSGAADCLGNMCEVMRTEAKIWQIYHYAKTT